MMGRNKNKSRYLLRLKPMESTTRNSLQSTLFLDIWHIKLFTRHFHTTRKKLLLSLGNPYKPSPVQSNGILLNKRALKSGGWLVTRPTEISVANLR